MLTKVVFILAAPSEVEGLTGLAAELKKHNVSVVVQEMDTARWEREEELKNFCQHVLRGRSGGYENLLVIADQEAVCECLKKEGCFVAALFRDENRNQCFADVRYGFEGFEEVDHAYLKRIYQRYAGLPWDILETERCYLREITVADVDALYEIYAEPSITLYMENLYENKEEERRYTQNYIEHIYAYYGYGMWLIVHKETGVIIGRAGFECREDFDGLEIGYMVAKGFQRQGIALEVCKSILQYAVKELGVEEISSFVQKENAASVGLCRKLGFVHQGTVLRGQQVLEQYVWQQ